LSSRASTRFEDFYSENPHIERNALAQYLGLPGLLNDQFINTMADPNQSLISLDQFYVALRKVFCSSLDDKLELCFSVFDFNHDGMITTEDVSLIMYHIGVATRDKVVSLVEHAFDGFCVEMDFTRFRDFTLSRSSEMLIAVMRCFQEYIPCAPSILR
jgi:Ca2+-binding EF-hand superfamily protein